MINQVLMNRGIESFEAVLDAAGTMGKLVVEDIYVRVLEQEHRKIMSNVVLIKYADLNEPIGEEIIIDYFGIFVRLI